MVAAGTPVLSVAVEGSKEVQIAVPEMDVAQFTPGKTVKARFWSATDLVLDGKVREVAGAPTPSPHLCGPRQPARGQRVSCSG